MSCVNIKQRSISLKSQQNVNLLQVSQSYQNFNGVTFNGVTFNNVMQLAFMAHGGISEKVSDELISQQYVKINKRNYQNL